MAKKQKRLRAHDHNFKRGKGKRRRQKSNRGRKRYNAKFDVSRCPECGAKPVLVQRDHIYGKGGGPVADRIAEDNYFWACSHFPRCDTYVRCHPGKTTPTGKLANRVDRKARIKAHAAIDTVWTRSMQDAWPARIEL